jgi:ubiquinone/menaquinone biosynthesis C-methylase UbiE
MKNVFCGNDMDKMPDWAFRIMAFMFNIANLIISKDKKLDPFHIQKSQTVVDYGSGTGRYISQASELVGDEGLVYAVDIHELAVRSAFRMIKKHNLKNVRPVLTDGKTVNIPSQTADIIYALDMFHMVKNTQPFLQELNRIMKPGGTLFLEDGHQPRSLTREKVLSSECWVILEETKTFIKCSPIVL